MLTHEVCDMGGILSLVLLHGDEFLFLGVLGVILVGQG